MIIARDRARLDYAEGRTVACDFQSITGTAAVDSSYPITNIWDTTSEQTLNESLYLSKYVKIDFSTSDEFAIRFDLGNANSAARYGLLAGVRQPSITGLAGTQISNITLQYSTDNAAWSNQKSIDSAGTDSSDYTSDWDTLNTPTIAFRGGTRRTARYWRYKFTAGANGSVHVGYAGIYDTLVGPETAAPEYTYIDRNIYSEGATGARFATARNPVRTLSLYLPAPTGGQISNWSRINDLRATKDTLDQTRIDAGTIAADFYDPASFPILGVFNDVRGDVGDDSAQIEENLTSFMALADKDYTVAYRSLYTAPVTAAINLREWVS